jgi:hypothetical protein
MDWKVEHVSVRYAPAVDLHRHRRHDDSAVDHRNHERIVELASLPTRFEAEIAIAALEARGIKATADHGDAAGWDPMLSIWQGHRVRVFEGDLETARAILADSSEQ